MNILLHICCAPCALYPIDELRREGHVLAGYFFNPNIHPYSEFLKRRDAVAAYGKETGLNINYGPYSIDDFFQHAAGNSGAKNRCPVCWWIRMLQAARFAKENGFDAFTTTLLVSPYQDHAALKSIGEDVARNCGTTFFYKDFRPGFKDAQSRAREKGIYLQKYCGCLYSEMERLEKKGQGQQKIHE